MSDKISEKIEIDLLLDAIFLRHGYDFRNYARSSLMRRLHYIKQKNGLTYISDMIPKVLYDEAFTNQLLLDLSVTVTEMFRDPEFLRSCASRLSRCS